MLDGGGGSPGPPEKAKSKKGKGEENTSKDSGVEARLTKREIMRIATRSGAIYTEQTHKELETGCIARYIKNTTVDEEIIK